MTDIKLWKVFSEYIRLRDSDENGFCKCFTCTRVAFWRKMDCGHGVGRQHWGTKYNEKNNHAQCKVCNGFEGGRADRYEKAVNKRYGPQTWDLLNIQKRQVSKWSQFEFDQLEKYYTGLVVQMKKEKNLAA